MQTEPGQPPPLRAVVVDGDDRVRESLARLLCIGDRIEVVGSAGASQEAIDVIVQTRPDIVIVDPRLPEPATGLAFIESLRALVPGVRVLIISGTDPADQPDLVRSADGFVRKTYRPSDLVAAVIAVAVPLA